MKVGRNWSYLATTQGTLGPPEAGTQRKDSPLEPLEGAWLC